MARPRSFDEKQVLRAVRDHFWDAGYAATSLEDLMRVSGLGKGSLYAAFGDKHRLFLTALRAYADENHAALCDIMDSAPRAVEALRLLLTAPVADAETARRGCMLLNTTCELAAADPDVRAEAARTYEKATEMIAGYVARAQREGDIPATADPGALARELLTVRQGLVFMGRTGIDLTALEATARSLADRLLPL
ncbi:TetR/AcrR family transcriptional regulator [Sphaerisporangium sp. B11E5]|uniref:TetR/AcrR family transcriptional regulator n=1 Tax=Sphaerisporangium sp. B11E5 TaxID=3153563 RepID=UPI00325F75B7